MYSDEEVLRLIDAAQDWPPRGGVPGMYACLLGLLSVTGLRISEALNLQSKDVDLTERLLTIRGTKFGKSRLVPIHASTQSVLSDTCRGVTVSSLESPSTFSPLDEVRG